MKKLKNAIIRWLGGNTDEAVAKALCATVESTYHAVVDHLIEYADYMDGTPGDEWASKMYSHLQYLKNTVTKREVLENTIHVTTKITKENEN